MVGRLILIRFEEITKNGRYYGGGRQRGMNNFDFGNLFENGKNFSIFYSFFFKIKGWISIVSLSGLTASLSNN